MISVHRGSVAAIRDAILAGVPDGELAGRAVGTAREGFALLARGLDGYAGRPAPA